MSMLAKSVQFMLNVFYVETLKRKILPLPDNIDIDQMIENQEQMIRIVNKKGKAEPAIVCVIVVNEYGIPISI